MGLTTSLTVLALLAPGTAPAAPTWLPQVDISAQAEGAGAPKVAIDGEGGVVAVWGSSGVIKVATRAPGEGWSEPRNLSLAGVSASEPRLAIDAVGNAVVVWARADGQAKFVVQAAIRTPGGAWSEPRDISPADKSASGATVGIDDHANAHVVWLNQTDSRIQAVTRPAQGDWSEPQDISSGVAFMRKASVAVDGEGNAVAVWESNDAGTETIQAAARPAGGTWGGPEQVAVAEPDKLFEGLVLAAAKGKAIALWTSGDGLNQVSDVQAAVRGPTGWGGALTLSAAGQLAGIPQVAVDDNGNAVAVWRAALARFEATIQARARPADGGWEPAQTLSPLQETAEAPQVGVGRNGAAVAVWRRFEGTDRVPDVGGMLHPRYTVFAATRPAGGAWGPPHDLSGTASYNFPDVAVDAQGNAVAAWSGLGSIPIRARGYDASGPLLRRQQVPPGGVAGSPVSFSVSPVDVWSEVESTTWSFGDGSGAVGNRVSHTYAAPGVYRVEVSSTDRVGNTSAETYAVRIEGARPGRPGGGGPASAPGSGGSQAGSPSRPRGRPLGSELRRRRAFRRCLAQAGRHGRRPLRGSILARARGVHPKHRARRRRARCVARYGRRPGRVTGLRARAISQGTVRISFKAPGTRGRRPPAAHTYLIKQSSRRPRGRRSTGLARSLCGGRCRLNPRRVGDRVSLVITDLRPGAAYSYRIAARDNVTGRLGPLSRTVRVSAG